MAQVAPAVEGAPEAVARPCQVVQRSITSLSSAYIASPAAHNYFVVVLP